MRSDGRKSVELDALLLYIRGPEGAPSILSRAVLKAGGSRERMMEVAEHYHHFNGVSPINSQNRALISALERALANHDLSFPVYWGNRNWHPLLADTVRRMAADGIQRALALVTSAYSSYSNCRQYLENIEDARREVGCGAPEIDKIRPFFHHPGYIETMEARVRSALDRLPDGAALGAPGVYATAYPGHGPGLRVRSATPGSLRLISERGRVLLGAGISEPQRSDRAALAGTGFCDYSGRFTRRAAGQAARADRAGQEDADRAARADRADQAALADRDIVLIPVGFISDHMEVVYDLDVEARACCDELGVRMVRAETAGTHPRFVETIVELVEERLSPTTARAAAGVLDPWPDRCPPDCCPSGR